MNKKNVKMNEKNCIWKDEEYLMFINAINPNTEEYLLFELLYIGGLRVGEALALTPMDFNFKENTLTINKSLTYINDKAVITSTKGSNDNRKIHLPKIILNKIEYYIKNNDQIRTNTLMFSTSRYKLNRMLDDKCKSLNIPQKSLFSFRKTYKERQHESKISNVAKQY